MVKKITEDKAKHVHELYTGVNVCMICGLHPGKESYEEALKFTGVARSVEAYENQDFKNFRIVTLVIENGVVKEIKKSDAYANFEAIAKVEMMNEIAIHNLNNSWQHGKAWNK